MDILFLVLGFILLILGGEFALRGTVGLARFMGVSPAIIGLTVMGIGTSAPELVVTVQSVLAGNADIAVGNAIGSNIANTLLILGMGALVRPLSCDPRAVRHDGTMMLFCCVAAVRPRIARRNCNLAGRVDVDTIGRLHVAELPPGQAASECRHRVA